MQRGVIAYGAILIGLLAPIRSFGKGQTVQIVITSNTLSSPVKITEQALLDHFNVWSGPGAGDDKEGMNVNWRRGIAHPPQGLPEYTVAFVTTRSNPGTYVVHYVINPKTGEGFVYIPGKSDPNYRDNTWLIYRGIEGNWFHASREWQHLLDPLISKNRTYH